MKEFILSLFYHLTAYLPRRLPRSQAEFERMQTILVDHYGLPNEPRTWMTVAGQLASNDGHRLRMPWGFIVNQVKHLETIELARNIRERATNELKQMLADKMREIAESTPEQPESAEMPPPTAPAPANSLDSLRYGE